MTTFRRRLAEFSGANYDKGRSFVTQALWVITSEVLLTKVWVPSTVRVRILRMFGATIGEGVLIRHNVRIHWPWKLNIGSDVWIGVDAWILNLENVSIGSDVCISQGVLLCTGSHDSDSPSFEFDNAPIVIEDGVWIAARSTVLRGVTVGTGSVIGATCLVTKSTAPYSKLYAPRATQINQAR
jgi:putative colanic acid biosynthesis acetyltransferase WcaF